MVDISENKTGISSAVDEAIEEQNDEFGWSGRQLSLLPSTPMLPDAQKRGRGRPPGAKNKNITDWVKYIGSRYTNPLIFLAETYNRPVGELASELGCSKHDAFKIQMAAATKMTEFTNQKMPTTVDLGLDGDLSLIIQTAWQGDGSEQGSSAIEDGSVSFDFEEGEFTEESD